MKKPWITAHAGFDGTPENTEASLREALPLSPDAVEVDVRRGGDGSLMLSHQAEGAAGTCCTLARAIEIVLSAPALRINCDLKEPGLEPAVLELARDLGALGRVILTGDVRPEAVESLQRSVQVCLNLECLLPDLGGRGAAGSGGSAPLSGEEMDFLFREAERCRIRAFNLPYRLFTEGFAARAAERGVGLSLWTVDSLSLLRKLIAAAPLNITTRAVRAALRIRDGSLPGATPEGEGRP